MQAENEGVCTIEDFETTYIPVEILSCDVGRSRTTDPLSIVELGKQLLQYAKIGNTEMVRDLMCRGAPFTTDWLGTSALHFAAQNNHLETAEVLLRAGISRDARTKVDRTPLHMAAYEGHHEMAQLLLNYGAEVDSKDMLKMTPLHWAVEQQHAEVMLVLLEHGANAHSVCKFDRTPISLALEHNRLDFVELLQQEREVVNIQEDRMQPAEIETATQNLMQLEAERLKQDQERMELEEELEKKRAKQQAVNTKKKQKVVYQQKPDQPVSEVGEVNKGLQKLEENTAHLKNKKHKEFINLTDVEQPLKLLQAHGITMIPIDDDTTIVENAMESGQTVVLTEAGKLALNLTKSKPINVTPIKQIQVNAKKGAAKKVITLRADQILGQNFSSPNTSRGPNILKRTTIDGKNARKIFLKPIGTTTKATATSTASTSSNTLETQKIITPKTEPLLLHLDGVEDIFVDTSNNEQIAELNRKLTETRREVAEYRRQLKKKEEEAELYKQQLKNLIAQRAVMKSFQ